LSPAANAHNGVKRTNTRRKSLLRFFEKKDSVLLFIYQVLGMVLLII